MAPLGLLFPALEPGKSLLAGLALEGGGARQSPHFSWVSSLIFAMSSAGFYEVGTDPTDSSMGFIGRLRGFLGLTNGPPGPPGRRHPDTAWLFTPSSPVAKGHKPLMFPEGKGASPSPQISAFTSTGKPIPQVIPAAAVASSCSPSGHHHRTRLRPAAKSQPWQLRVSVIWLRQCVTYTHHYEQVQQGKSLSVGDEEPADGYLTFKSFLCFMHFDLCDEELILKGCFENFRYGAVPVSPSSAQRGGGKSWAATGALCCLDLQQVAALWSPCLVPSGAAIGRGATARAPEQQPLPSCSTPSSRTPLCSPFTRPHATGPRSWVPVQRLQRNWAQPVPLAREAPGIWDPRETAALTAPTWGSVVRQQNLT
ncbi:hypothetical protein GW7_14674 [Heterocephalus glaber]|uniref:Uncharacterized protein n=1 Tax=Heterocephalus glaber TaxID=10181 RepID=G5BGX1_HETGA|nr:hypothetical protein GW7_14674 [Heterocephalus glaber]